MTWPIETLVFLLLAGAVLGICYWRLVRRANAAEVDPDWLLEFSADRYAILARMLDGVDFDWVLGQTDGDDRLCHELRSSRRKAFRIYLGELSRDFRRLELISKGIVVDSPEDESNLTRFLFRQGILFRFRLLSVRLRLGLSRFRPGKVDVGPLLELVQGTHGRLFWLAAAQNRPSAL